MDANQVGFVHELSMDEIREILDNAISIKPRRQMSVQFSGGEPSISPHFIESIKYARKVGYNSVQAATNGIEFAKSKDFCRQAAEAGLRYVYLQFDGVGNDANSHRQVGNLFDVKMRAINNLHEAGVEIVLVTTWLTASTTIRSDRSSGSPSTIPKRLPSFRSSRFPLPVATRRSRRNAGCNSVTRFRTWRTTSRIRLASLSQRATGSRCH